MSNQGELKDRVEARKHQLLSKYNELKADTRKEAGEARVRMKARLDEVEEHLKIGWTNMTEATKAKLHKWLDHKD
ncbi:MAG TPA: hypothetical protein VN253_22330 [Kofleriaceae bacterium]|nr:hypothetical protein [Kofleriaceae bacterium]